MGRFIVLVLCMGMSTLSAWAETTVLTNARVLSAVGDANDQIGTLIIEDDKIASIGPDVPLPVGARVIDLGGKTITPGFVVSNTTLGVLEISDGAEANDSSTRSMHLSAGVDIRYALNPSSTLIPVARNGGITRAIVTPGIEAVEGRQSFYAGQAAVIHLGDSPRLVVREKAGVVVDLSADKLGRGAAFVQLRAERDDVRRYSRKRSLLERGLLRSREWHVADLDALVPVIMGEAPMVIEAHRASDITTLLQYAAETDIKLILVGVSEGWRVATTIAEAGVPVVLNPTDNLPGDFDRLGATLANAALLEQAGVTIVIRGGRSGHDARQLRYFAGVAVAHGLSRSAALKAITVNPARAWGETGFGTLAPGQDADIAVWTGDPFEPLTDLVALYIRGRPQPLQSRETLLRDRYIAEHQNGRRNASASN